jgi:tetratricopeptide (TPR) repeat protein
MIETLFLNILSSLIYELLKNGKLGKLLSGDPISKAISKTAADFPDLTTTNFALKKWVESDDFIDQLKKLTGTIEEVQISSLTNDFIEVSDFYDNIRFLKGDKKAGEVLAKFFTNLEFELYQSDYADYINSIKLKLSKNAISSEINDLSKQGKSDTNKIINRIDQLEETFKQSPSPIDIDSAPEVKEKIYSTRMDFAIELLREGKSETALEKLKKLRVEIAEEDISVNLLFRIAANIGVCYLHLERLKEAQKEFEHAHSLKPSNKIVLSNLALVLSLRGDNDRAVELATESKSEDKHKSETYANFIRIMHNAGKVEIIDELIETETWVLKDPNCLIALGLVKFDKGKCKESEEFLRKAVKGDAKNPHAFRLLAQTIIYPIDQIIQNNPPNYISKEHINRLKEAEEYQSKAIEIFEKQENTESLFYTLLQRAYTRDLLGKKDEALSDCDWLLRIKPDSDEVKKQKGQIFLFSNEIEKALECFNHISDKNLKEESVLATALAYIQIQNFKEVINLLEDRVNLSDRSRRQTVLLDLLLTAYHFEKETSKETNFITKLDKERPNDPDILTITARNLLAKGKTEDALERYERAISNAQPGNQLSRISIGMADVYYGLGRWKEAANNYQNNVDTDSDNELNRRYVISLYNSGARDI